MPVWVVFQGMVLDGVCSAAALVLICSTAFLTRSVELARRGGLSCKSLIRGEAQSSWSTTLWKRRRLNEFHCISFLELCRSLKDVKKERLKHTWTLNSWLWQGFIDQTLLLWRIMHTVKELFVFATMCLNLSTPFLSSVLLIPLLSHLLVSFFVLC